MAKYKVGDKVRVIPNGERDKRYYMEDKSSHNSMVDQMLYWCGKVVTIKAVNSQYHIEECGYGWVDEMFEGLAEEKPIGFKVGDRVKVNEEGLENWGALKENDVDFGTVIVCEPNGRIGIEFDKKFCGHDCDGSGKNGHCWWLYDDEIELVKEEPKPTPTPIEVNITVNLYEKSCWYCRKGGVVDLYLNGAMGICPSCKRVCNNTPFKLEPKGKGVYTAPKKPKKNEPLTVEELKALPNGTKVYIVWCWDMKPNKKGKPRWNESGWGVKKKEKVWWKSPDSNNNWQGIEDADRCFDAYLEEPERPESELELPF